MTVHYQDDKMIIFEDKAVFNKSKAGSNRGILYVHFFKNNYLWVPTYKQIDAIMGAINSVECRSWGNRAKYRRD